MAILKRRILQSILKHILNVGYTFFNNYDIYIHRHIYRYTHTNILQAHTNFENVNSTLWKKTKCENPHRWALQHQHLKASILSGLGPWWSYSHFTCVHITSLQTLMNMTWNDSQGMMATQNEDFALMVAKMMMQINMLPFEEKTKREGLVHNAFLTCDNKEIKKGSTE